MTDYTTDIIFESKNRKSARVLENHIWDDYIGYSNSIEKVVAYQWKKSEKIADDDSIISVKDFNIFAKTLIRDNNNSHLWQVFIFIVIVGALGGILGNAITVYCFHSFNPFQISIPWCLAIFIVSYVLWEWWKSKNKREEIT